MIRPTPIVTQSDTLAHNRATLFNNLLPDQTEGRLGGHRGGHRRAANPISGGAETPVEVEGTKGLLCCNHRNLPSYIILLFDQTLLFAMQSWGSQI